MLKAFYTMRLKLLYIYPKLKVMRAIIWCVFSLLSVHIYSQELPLGYISHFHTDFSGSRLDKNILLSGNLDYKLSKGYIIINEKPDSVPGFPIGAMLLIDNNIFGDFITTTQLSYSAERTDSLSGIVFLAGLRDSSNYYFIRLTENGASFNQVYKGVQSEISYDSSLAILPGKLVSIRITRDILTRSLTIKYNGSKVSFTDPNLVMGYIGFGTSGYIMKINDIKVWAPTSIAEPANVFR